MRNSNVKKLVNFMYGITKAETKASAFNNLESCKDNKILITDKTVFEGDDKEVIELQTLHALNQYSMNLIKGEYILIGSKGKQKFKTPLFYTDIKLQRNGDKIEVIEEGERTLNIGAVSCVVGENESLIETTIENLMQCEEIENFEEIFRALIPLDENLRIEKQTALILAKLPDSTMTILNELKELSKIYE